MYFLKIISNKYYKMYVLTFLKNYWKNCIFLFVLVMVSASPQACKSPAEPEVIPIYLSRVEVTYTRNPAKIINNLEYDEQSVILRCELYDPYQAKTPPYVGPDPDFRYESIEIERIAENRFRGYLENVLVQDPSVDVKHTACVWDWRLYDGTHRQSQWTGEGLDIERAYDLELLPVAFGGNQLRFKISQN
jgi:hypothetical protein